MLRLASPRDSSSVSQLISLCLNDPHEESQVSLVLSSPDHITYVVETAGEVIGFADSFITQSHDGTLRLELDLLAVHPAHRGRGLAARLIDGCTQQAFAHGVQQARGLVARTNTASQHAFTKAGYNLHADIQALNILPSVALSPLHNLAHLIRVSTLTYQGYWLESPDLVKLSTYLAEASPVPSHWRLGMVISQAQLQAYPQLIDHVLTINHYQWWVKTSSV
jgi:GNAT superfamily N-acetyltransferase